MSEDPKKSVMTDEEWLRRYDAYVNANSNHAGSYSEEIGREVTLVYRQDVGFKYDPEGAAEEEMGNWEQSSPDECPMDERLERLSQLYERVPLLGYMHKD